MSDLFPDLAFQPVAVSEKVDVTEQAAFQTMHALLIERGATWLQSQKCVVIVTDLTHYGSETPDVIGWKAGGWSVLIECKASRSDFHADKHKSFRRYPEMGMGDNRFYLAPAGLLKPEEMPMGWGLLEWTGKKVVKRLDSKGVGSLPKGASRRMEMSVLVSAMRRMGNVSLKGVSVKAYTYETKCRATVGVAKVEENGTE